MLIVFSLATIGWTMTAIDDTLIVLAAAATLVATRTVPTSQLYLALGSELIWLMIGSFVIAAALRASGLAERLALSALQPFSRVVHAWDEVRIDRHLAVQALEAAPGWTQPRYIGWAAPERLLRRHRIK